MQWMVYVVFAGLAVLAILAGAIGGGSWWWITGIGLVLIAGWLVTDLFYKRRERGGERAAAKLHSDRHG